MNSLKTPYRMVRRTVPALLGAAGLLGLMSGGPAQAQSAFPRSQLAPSPYVGHAPLGAPVAAPEDEMGPPPGGETVRINLDAGAAPARTLALPRGKSAVIELPVDARDVMVSDPKVADVVLSTPRRIYVVGVAAGQTDAMFFDGAGRQLLRLDIRVDHDVSALAQTLNRILPGNAIRVEAVNDSLVLSGEVRSPADADKAVRLAQSFTAKPEDVINMLAVAAPEQVMLKVRIVEVQRNIVKQLGFNWQGIAGALNRNKLAFALAPTYGVNGSLLGGGGLSYEYAGNENQLTAMLQAFERAGLIRTLAEPNLTAVSGESAKFLAGGEFPVPVGEDNTGRVTVDFKPFGVGLGFTPVVLSEGRISLKISTEYSELTNVGAFTMSNGVSSSTGGTSTGGTSGTAGTTPSGPSLTVPGLNVRRAETVVELPSGGAFMIAGLLQSTTKETLDALPGLKQLPVLGALFRSRDFQENESELVIIVTPYLVKPVRPDQLQTPADGLQIADDPSSILLGRLNKGLGHPADPAPGKTYQGPYGYVVD